MFTSPTEIAFSIGSFDIYFYGITMALAVFTGFYVSYFICKKYYKEINAETLYDIILPVLICGFICARLYFCIMDYPYYFSRPLEILNVRQGGLSIHGGIIGGIISGIIYCKLKNFSFLKYADIFSFGVVIAQAIGRWGNFFNSEAFGKPTTSFLSLYIPLAKRPIGYEEFEYFQPTFLYESIANLLIFCVLFFIIRKYAKDKCGITFASYLLLYSIARFIIESYRIDSVLNIGSMPIAQAISIIITILSTSFIIYRLRK